MMSNKGDTAKRIICPYNAAHNIIPHRLQTHLVKCRKNYPDTKIVVCMYNSTHRVPEPELAFHLDSCVDRVGLDKFVFAPKPVEENKIHVPIIDLQPLETWDDEERESYNPEQHCLNNPVLRKKDTLPKAQRKDFRWQERQRMQQFSSQSDTNLDNDIENQSTSHGHPRRPHTFSKGLENKNDLVEDDVSKMLMKIQLGANRATVPPKLQQQPNLSTNRELNEPENTNQVLESRLDMNSFPTISQPLHYPGGNGTKPKSSRGRGSTFGKK